MSTSSPIANLSSPVDVLVVGAGISGLAIAHGLACDRQIPVMVTESQNRVGGSIISVRNPEGFQWEEGPNSFAPTPDLLRLAIAVGLRDELIFADRKLPRFVFWEGRLHAVPMHPLVAVKTRLLSLGGKLRALRGALGFVRPPMAGEETVEEFFSRQLGKEVMQRLVAPFVSGVYAGSPTQLSAGAAFRKIVALEQNYGGLVAGAVLSRKAAAQVKQPVQSQDIPQTKAGELGSFRQGLHALPTAIADKLRSHQVPIKLEWQLRSLQQDESGIYTATYHTPEGIETITARSVVLTTPAYVTGGILKNLEPNVSKALSQIPYPSVACVVLAYPQSEIKPELSDLRGFGNLIPRNQGVRTLGTIWASSLFPNRAPQGWHLFLNFIGGATDREIANLTEAEIVQAVHQDLCKTILRSNTNASPKVIAVHLWRKAIPQYTLGHLQRLETITKGLKQRSGLFVSSNYINGVSLGDCVKQANQIIPQVEQFLTTHILHH